MTSTTTVTTAPYTESGSLMHYPEDRLDYSDAGYDPDTGVWARSPRVVAPVWRPNAPFAATLRLDRIQRARPADYLVWVDDAGREFPMLLPDLVDLIKSGNVIAGNAIAGCWMVVWRDGVYGVRLAADDEIHAASGCTEPTGTDHD